MHGKPLSNGKLSCAGSARAYTTVSVGTILIPLLLASCQREVEQPPPGDVVGRAIPLLSALPANEEAWSMPVAAARSGCRVLTVTHAQCGISAALAQGWVEDLTAIIDSLRHLEITTGWVVFSQTRDGVDRLYRRVRGGVPATWWVQGSAPDVETFTGMSGYPQTLVVTADDTIRFVVSGNQLPSADVLTQACDPDRY